MRSFISLRPGSRFRSIYRSGTRGRVRGVTVLQADGEALSPEVGVVAGKAVGNAVQRNRSKRRIREAMDRSDLQPGTAYVVVASHEVLDASFEELSGWVSSALVKGSRPR